MSINKAEKFNGKYLEIYSVKFEQYMKALGVCETVRKSAAPLIPTMEVVVSNDGKQWKFTSAANHKDGIKREFAMEVIMLIVNSLKYGYFLNTDRIKPL
jgi:hypothetical protein